MKSEFTHFTARCKHLGSNVTVIDEIGGNVSEDFILEHLSICGYTVISISIVHYSV